jgi:hypothetical protein
MGIQGGWMSKYTIIRFRVDEFKAGDFISDDYLEDFLFFEQDIEDGKVSKKDGTSIFDIEPRITHGLKLNKDLIIISEATPISSGGESWGEHEVCNIGWKDFVEGYEDVLLDYAKKYNKER